MCSSREHHIQLLQDSLGAQQAPRGLRTIFQVGLAATSTGKAANLVVASPGPGEGASGECWRYGMIVKVHLGVEHG